MKIYDIRGAEKPIEYDLPIKKRDLLKKISKIDPEIADEYTKAITDYIETLFLIRNVICSVEKPNTYQHLLEQMDEVKINNLEEIVDLLLSDEPINQIEKLIELTFNIKNPSEEAIAKSKEVIEKIKASDANRAEIAYGFLCFSKRASLLSGIYTLLACKEDYEQNVMMRLSKVSESELDEMIRVVNAI